MCDGFNESEIGSRRLFRFKQAIEVYINDEECTIWT